MLQNSILGSLYFYWINSKMFKVAYAIFLPFLRGFRSSKIMNHLFGNSRIELAYQNSKTAGIIDILILLVTSVPKIIYTKLKPSFENSYIIKLCTGSCFLRLEFILGAFICVMFIAPHEMWSNGFALLGSVGIFLLFLCSCAAGKRKLISITELGFPFLLFVITIFASLLFTSNLSDSIRVLLFFISSFVFTYICSAIITDRKQLNEVLFFIYVAVIATSLYAIAQRFIGVDVSSSLTDLANNKGVPGRVYSTLDNPNNYAEFLVIFMPISAIYAMNIKNTTWRFILCCALVFPAVAIIMTYSRSSWGALFLAAVVMIYFLNRKLIPIFIVVGVLAIPFLPASVMTRIMSVFTGDDTSMAHRFYIWDGIFLLLADDFNWLKGIGIGPETFNNIYPEYARRGATAGVFHSQMQYLEMILELGLLGLIAFMWVLFQNIKEGTLAFYRKAKTLSGQVSGAAACSLIGLLALFAVEYVWYYPRVMFAYFILLGIISAARKIEQ